MDKVYDSNEEALIIPGKCNPGEKREREAARWIQNQPGLKVLIGDYGRVTLTNGVTVEVTGIGFVDVVRKAQHILKNKRSGVKACF